MVHPFYNKLFTFTGTPNRCTRKQAIEVLISVGGVYDDRISDYTQFVVAFKTSETTDSYKKAAIMDRLGYLILLNEKQFFDVVEGNSQLPEKKKPDEYERPYSYWDKIEKMMSYDYQDKQQEFIKKKRIMNQEKYCNYNDDGKKYILDVNHLKNPDTIVKYLKAHDIWHFDKGKKTYFCKKCSNPSTVFISDNYMTTELCKNCYNRMLATIYDTDMPHIVPKKLSFKNKDGLKCEFAIEFMIFTTGKMLTAFEIGKYKRKIEVFGKLCDNFDDMMTNLKRRVIKALSTQYIGADGHLAHQKAIGYIEYDSDTDGFSVVIDGKPYKWSELEHMLSPYEGWQIKIEIREMSDDIE